MRTSLCPFDGKLGGSNRVERFPIFRSGSTDAFHGRPGCYFWSNGYAWGTCTVTDDTATIEVLKGSLQLDKLVIGDKEKRLKNFRLASGENRIIKLS